MRWEVELDKREETNLKAKPDKITRRILIENIIRNTTFNPYRDPNLMMFNAARAAGEDVELVVEEHQRGLRLGYRIVDTDVSLLDPTVRETKEESFYRLLRENLIKIPGRYLALPDKDKD